jgi:hypothetical protein
MIKIIDNFYKFSFFPQALPHQSLSICHMATKPDLSVPPPVLQHASQTPRTTNNQGMGINFSSNDSSRFGAFSGSPMATNLNLQPPTLPLPFQHKKNVSSTSIPPLSVGQSSVSSTLTTPTLPLNASPASIVMSSAQTMPNQNQLQLVFFFICIVNVVCSQFI